MLQIFKPPTAPSDGEIYLTVEQAANYTQLPASSIVSLIHSGKLKVYRIAGKKTVLVRRCDLAGALGN